MSSPTQVEDGPTYHAEDGGAAVYDDVPNDTYKRSSRAPIEGSRDTTLSRPTQVVDRETSAKAHVYVEIYEADTTDHD